jgi:hypothetical protein
MRLSRVTPKLGGFPELRSYQCGDCAHVLTIECDEAAAMPTGGRFDAFWQGAAATALNARRRRRPA